MRTRSCCRGACIAGCPTDTRWPPWYSRVNVERRWEVLRGVQAAAAAVAAETTMLGIAASLGAAIVLRPGSSVTPAELHTWLRTRLTAALTPSRFIFPPALPLAPSGKVDRAAELDIRLAQFQMVKMFKSVPKRRADP